MRPVTQGDILAAARALLARREEDWPLHMAQMLDHATRADRYRLRYGRAHPLYGNGTLTSATLRLADMPPAGDRRLLAAQGAVIAALLARSECLERHGGQRAADAGDVEKRL